MLNPGLFNSLRVAFGQEPEICNLGMEGVFSCPPVARTRLGRKTKRMAYVEHWGETYALNCPVCGDTRRRLYFSHLYLGATKANTVTYYFGELYKCQNESCNLNWYVNKIDVEENTLIETKPRAFTGIVLQESELPKGCLPLLSPEVPTGILDYIRGRGFELTELANEYFVHVAPKGATYAFGDETREFYDDRLIIPVIQGRRLVGWQARRCKDLPKDKYKYLNSDVKKSACLYNRDVAMFYRDIAIVEGVTDCWRIGPDCVATFGKDASNIQIELLKALWGFSGSAVVCYDTDDATAVKKQIRLVLRLRKEKVFPRGVAELRLPPGTDPANLTRSRVRELIQEARAGCK